MTEDHVRRSLLAAIPPERLHRQGKDNTANSGAKLQLINGASVQPEPIRWCWRGWMARGKLHLLAGAAGTGKTSIAMSLAAAITSGSPWPNGDAADYGDVLVWSGEDGTADTLLPRFLLAGGDARRITFVGAMQQGHLTRPFDPAVDVAQLSEAAKDLPGLKLVIIDPVSAAVAGDSHKNAETRRSLQPLVDLAAERDCVVLGITHFSKGTAGKEPLERVMGSIAFGAVARVVLATVRPSDPDAPRRLVRVKSNLGPDGGGVEYSVSNACLPHSGINAQRVKWGKPLSGTARELMAVEQTDQHRAAREEASAFLSDLLQHGPVPTKQIREAAIAHGHAARTLTRAKKELGVRARKPDNKAGWTWELPARRTAEDGQQP